MNLVYVLNTIGPLLLLVSLGAALRRWGFARQELFQGVSRLVYWVGLPCLLFLKTAQAGVALGAAGRMFGIFFGGMMLSIVVGYLIGGLLGVGPKSLGAFVQGAYRGNMAYVGIPLMTFVLDPLGTGANSDLQAAAVVALAPLIAFYNVAAVIVLLAGQHHEGASLGARLRKVASGVVTNPLIIACLGGLLFSLTGGSLPPIAVRSLKAVGQMALPLALIAIGASLTFRSLHGRAIATVAAATIKVALAPLVLWALYRPLGLSVDEFRIGLIYLACPTAALSFIMAERLGGDEKLAGAIVALAFVLSVPAFTIILLAVR